MFKLVVVAGIIALLAACSSMSDPAYRSGSMGGSNTAVMGASRSSGEGPALNPRYAAPGSN